MEKEKAGYRLMAYFLALNVAGLTVAAVLAILSGPVAALAGFGTTVSMGLYVFYGISETYHEAPDHHHGNPEHEEEGHFIVPVD